MADSYYDGNGNMMVWTGTGYQAVPMKIAAGDAGSVFKSQDVWSQGDSPYLIQGAKDMYGITNWNPYSSIAGLQDENWQLDPTNNSADAFSYLLKSGDKVGGRFTYNRQDDGSYAGQYMGPEKMDTSANYGAALLPLAAAGAMYAAPYMMGSAAGEAGGLVPLGEGAVPALSSASTIAEPAAGLFGGLGETLGSAGTWAANPSNWSTIAKGVGLLGGALAGGATGGNNVTSTGPRSVAPSTVPTMYGGGGTGAPRGLLDNWGASGPTQTEAMMRRYMTNLLGI